MDEKQKKEKLDVKKFEKLIDWGIQTQLTWAVIFLTCFVGLIELLPNIPRLDNPPFWRLAYSGLTMAIYIFLVIALDYSMLRSARIVRDNFEWATRLKETTLADELIKTRGWAVGKLFGKHGEKLLWGAILISTAVWLAVLFLKVFLA